jgi:hypothetical protein
MLSLPGNIMHRLLPLVMQLCKPFGLCYIEGGMLLCTHPRRCGTQEEMAVFAFMYIKE